MRSPRDGPNATAGGGATALSALVLLTATRARARGPVVYQSDPATAELHRHSADASGAAHTSATANAPGSPPAARRVAGSATAAPLTASPTTGLAAAVARPQAGNGPRRRRRPAPTRPPEPRRAQQPSPATAGDPFSDLGGRSPSCRQGAAGQGSANCRATGSPAHRYPIGNYTYDIKIDTGLTHFSDNLLAALQTIASFLWLGFLYAIKGVLLALDWAFHLNFINTNIDKVQGGLLTMDGIFGLDSGYFSLALSLAALWGMWHGFVRGKYIETIAGLGACVGLMLIALLIVHDPAGTVGKAGNWGDSRRPRGRLRVAGAVQPGDPAQADEDGLDRGAQAIFDTVVLRPGARSSSATSTSASASRRPTPSTTTTPGAQGRRRSRAPTVADLWLAFPANGKERNKLYESWKDDGDTVDPAEGRDDAGAVDR